MRRILFEYHQPAPPAPGGDVEAWVAVQPTPAGAGVGGSLLAAWGGAGAVVRIAAFDMLAHQVAVAALMSAAVAQAVSGTGNASRTAAGAPPSVEARSASADASRAAVGVAPVSSAVSGASQAAGATTQVALDADVVARSSHNAVAAVVPQTALSAASGAASGALGAAAAAAVAAATYSGTQTRSEVASETRLSVSAQLGLASLAQALLSAGVSAEAFSGLHAASLSSALTPGPKADAFVELLSLGLQAFIDTQVRAEPSATIGISGVSAAALSAVVDPQAWVSARNAWSAAAEPIRVSASAAVFTLRIAEGLYLRATIGDSLLIEAVVGLEVVVLLRANLTRDLTLEAKL